MYNWSIETKRLKKDRKKYEIWRLEQAINYGLAGKRINYRILKKYINNLSIDPHKKKFLKMLI